MSIKNVLLIIIVGIVVFISAQNTQGVTLKLLAWDNTTPLIVLIYIIFFTGFIAGMLRSNIKHMLKNSREKTSSGNSFFSKLFGKKDNDKTVPGDARQSQSKTSIKK